MAINFSFKITRILYQSRFSEQKDFDFIVSGSIKELKHSEERVSFRISLPDLCKVETIYHSKRHSRCDRTVCEGPMFAPEYQLWANIKFDLH